MIRASSRHAVARLRRRAGGAPVLLTALLLGAHPSVAQAALGESQDAVERDYAALHGTSLRVSSTISYEVHQITTADAGTVRQYVDHGGTVFAVTWSGRVQPDLRRVLAAHYAQYLAAARAPHQGHHLLSVSTADLVLTVVKLPRGFAGHAHLPSLLPGGVKAEELR